MHPVQIYKLQDEAKQRKLEELTNVDNPTSLDYELGALRYLEQEALENGDAKLAVTVNSIIGRLSTAIENTKIRRGELLAKTVVIQLAMQISQLLAQELAGKFDGWELVLDNVREKSMELVQNASNTQDDVKRLPQF